MISKFAILVLVRNLMVSSQFEMGTYERYGLFLSKIKWLISVAFKQNDSLRKSRDFVKVADGLGLFFMVKSKMEIIKKENA